MAKGDILKTALAIPHKGPHRKAVIRSAMHREMEQFTATGSLPPGLDANEINEFLAPVDRQLTQDDEDQLNIFADFLADVDTDPTARPGNRLMSDKFIKDLGV
ncbi:MULTISPECIES: hypothetical protein [unclassified Pseudomonas]|uniref:hypothetical protein n=1 Tax=unclassified Pseudomonas TaxID=196821 RepID=UPI0011AF9A04|nr:MULTISPECIES: hypothetical protein [unclassified Pseudomonas]